MSRRVQHIVIGVITYALMLLASIVTFAQDMVADNMLLFQRDIGGWPKHYAEKAIDYRRTYSEVEKASIKDESGRNDATIDNNATTREIKYLVKAYKASGRKEYLDAAEKGIRYLLVAQYKNGGWPQFFPDKSSYRSEITFNDNAMINVMELLADIANKNEDFELISPDYAKQAAKAVRRGIDCILKTQVKVNGKLTVWCAQYNAETLEPAKARTFELASLSGSESVGIVEFLMKQAHPTNAIKNAITSAVAWFETSKINGYKFATVKDTSMPRGFDKVLMPEPGAELWARFYDIETNEPFFCGRDGIKKKNVADIEAERRTGYAWYGTWPKNLLEIEYPKWKSENS